MSILSLGQSCSWVAMGWDAEEGDVMAVAVLPRRSCYVSQINGVIVVMCFSPSRNSLVVRLSSSRAKLQLRNMSEYASHPPPTETQPSSTNPTSIAYASTNVLVRLRSQYHLVCPVPRYLSVIWSPTVLRYLPATAELQDTIEYSSRQCTSPR